MAKRTRRRWPWILGASVVLLAVVSVWLWPRPAPITHRTVTLRTTTVSQTVTAAGTINPAKRANLEFSGTGKVTAVKIAVGDSVKAGQLLATEEDATLKVALRLAEADLTAAKQNLANLKDSKAASTAIRAASATVDVKSNALTQAKANLTKASLVAPFDGLVAQVNVSVGDDSVVAKVPVSGAQGGIGEALRSSGGTAASTTTAAIVVIGADSFNVSTSVGSADVAMLRKGMPVAITPAGRTEPIAGTVSSVGVEATAQSGGGATFPVTIEVAGSHPGLLAGSSAQLVITVNEFVNVIAVPTQAITTTPEGATVRVLQADTPKPVKVTLGQAVGYQTIVTAGLSDGDVVVVGTLGGRP